MPGVSSGLNHSVDSQACGLMRNPRPASSSCRSARRSASQVPSMVTLRSLRRSWSRSSSGSLAQENRRADLRGMARGRQVGQSEEWHHDSMVSPWADVGNRRSRIAGSLDKMPLRPGNLLHYLRDQITKNKSVIAVMAGSRPPEPAASNLEAGSLGEAMSRDEIGHESHELGLRLLNLSRLAG